MKNRDTAEAEQEPSGVISASTQPLMASKTMIVQKRMTLDVCTQIMYSSLNCIVSAHSLMSTCHIYTIHHMPVSIEVSLAYDLWF